MKHRLVGVTLSHGRKDGPSVSLLVLTGSDESAVTIEATEAELVATEQSVMVALRPFLNNSTHVQIDAYGAGVRSLSIQKSKEDK